MTLTDEEIIARHDPSVRARAKIELEVIHNLIKALHKESYTITVDDSGGEEDYGDNEQEIITAVFAVDECHLITDKASSVFLVIGNDGFDVINDYSLSLESIIDPISEAAYEKYNG